MRCDVAQIHTIHTYRGDDAGAVGADEAGLVLGLEHVGDANHV